MFDGLRQAADGRGNHGRPQREGGKHNSALTRVNVWTSNHRRALTQLYQPSGVLRGLQAGRSVFLGQLAGAVAALVLGLPLTAWNAFAAVVGVAISAGSEVVATAYLLRRML